MKKKGTWNGRDVIIFDRVRKKRDTYQMSW